MNIISNMLKAFKTKGFMTPVGTVRKMCNQTTWAQNKVALVTGSTSGIGLGIARSLASKGCSIIYNGFGDDQLIESLKTEFLRKYKVSANYIYADFTNPSELDSFCEKVRDIHPSGVDILVNNAGFQYVCPVDQFPVDQWDAMVAVMLTTPFFLIKSFLPAMKEKGWGRLINIASVHGLIASPHKSAYIGCKHGLVGITKAVALEAAGSGVTCNAICPGYVDTIILKDQVRKLAEQKELSMDDAKKTFLEQFHPTGKAIGIDHLAQAVNFLCSDAASQMTGSNMVLDGGWTAK